MNEAEAVFHVTASGYRIVEGVEVGCTFTDVTVEYNVGIVGDTVEPDVGAPDCSTA